MKGELRICFTTFSERGAVFFATAHIQCGTRSRAAAPHAIDANILSGVKRLSEALAFSLITTQRHGRTRR